MNNKIFLIFAMAFLFVGLVSAGVEFVEEGGEYGKYVINTWIPNWLGGKGTSEVKLIQNTDQCLIDCSFTLEGTNEKPVSLIDDVKFLNRDGEDVSDNLKEITFYLGKYEEVEKLNYSKPIYSTEEVCNEPNLNETNSTEESCYYPVVDYENYNVDELIWTEYNGEQVEGYFQLKAEAKKEKISMDWIVEFRGKELSEWEWWNSDWGYKRQINLTADAGEFSYLSEINYSAGMQEDYDDLRFINNAENTEFNYTIETYNSTRAVVRIYSQGETSFWMYYGNSLATTTSNAVTTHFNPIAYYYLDETSGTTAYDSVGSNDGTNNGATINQAGKIGTAYDFDGTNDVVYLNSNFGLGGTKNISVSLWFNRATDSRTNIGIFSDDTDDSNDFSLMVNGDNSVEFIMGSENIGMKTTSNAFSNNVWNHVVITYDGSTRKIYINNELKTSGSYTGSLTSNDFKVGIDRSLAGRYFNGTIDEVGIWDKALTPEQIYQLYNYTAPTYIVGEEEIRKGVITIDYVTPPTPENNSNLSVNYIPVEVEINYTNATLDNITYDFYKGGELNQSYFFTNETLFVNHTGCQCDNWAFNVTACYTEQVDDTSSCVTTETRYLIIDSQPPVINITSPLTSYDYLYDNYTLDLNWSVEDVAGHLDSCWYEYNGVNNSLVCNDNTATFNYSTNVNNLTFYANDTFGNVGSEFWSWSVRVLENNQTYNLTTYETSKEDFLIYLTYNSSAFNPIVKLNYGETNYSSINIGTGDNGIFKSSIYIPVDNSTEEEFYFIIDTGTFLTESIKRNQTINKIYLQECNSTINQTVINLKFYDETTNNLLNSTDSPITINSFFKYWVGDGTIKKEYIYNTEENETNNYNFCIQENQTLNYNLDLVYSATNYNSRNLYVREEVLNETILNKTLYLIPTTKGIKFFHTVRQEIEPVADVLVEIYKFFISTGDYELISIEKTDIDGRFTEYLEEDKEYNYIIKSFENVELGNLNKNAICSIEPCEITLQIEEILINGFEELEAYLAKNVDYNLTYNHSTSTFHLSFEDLLGTSTYWRMHVFKKNYDNESYETICNDFAYASSGEISCDTSGYMGEIIAKVYISRSPEKLVDFLIKINESVTPALSITGLFASILILLIIIFTGSRNPSNALIMLPFGLILLKFIGFMPLSWGWIAGIVVFILLILNKMKN